MHIQFFGAAGEVTGSSHLVSVGSKRVLLDCGLVQGGRQDEARNREPFPFDLSSIDAVILSHAHIDHSGRLPLLVKSGYRGPIYTHKATADLCHTMLRDTASLAERDAKWENRKRARKGLDTIEPLFTISDADQSLEHFKGLDYGDKQEILPGIDLRLADAGHILGSAIVELWLDDGSKQRKLVYSGDLGRSGMPILEDPAAINEADLVLMESTYGDRLHRSWEDTLDELHIIFTGALSRAKGNILIPAFAVGRTQEILFLMAKHYREWDLERWHIFVDSPMAIEASEAYVRNAEIFDRESAQLWQKHLQQSQLPNSAFFHGHPRNPCGSTRFNPEPSSLPAAGCAPAGASNIISSTMSGAANARSSSPGIRRTGPLEDRSWMVPSASACGEKPCGWQHPCIPLVVFRLTRISRRCATGTATSTSAHPWCWSTVNPWPSKV